MTTSRRSLVASDLDGTLFGADGQVSGRTCNAIEAVVARGHAVIAVTGRSWRTAAPRLAAVPGIGCIIASNGACEYQLSTGMVTRSSPIAADAWPDWVERLRREFPHLSIGWESVDGLGFEKTFVREAGGIDQLENAGDSSWPCGRPLYKLYVRTPELTHAALQVAVRPLFGDDAEVSTSGAPFVEITAAGVDKAATLSRVAAERMVDAREVIAFGDNHNDLPMLRWAGLSVAMANAVPEALALADRRAADHADHGVARMLEHLLESGRL